nr:hypothetical protein CFP56_23159 [Quercus suber]
MFPVRCRGGKGGQIDKDRRPPPFRGADGWWWDGSSSDLSAAVSLSLPFSSSFFRLHLSDLGGCGCRGHRGWLGRRCCQLPTLQFKKAVEMAVISAVFVILSRSCHSLMEKKWLRNDRGCRKFMPTC